VVGLMRASGVSLSERLGALRFMLTMRVARFRLADDLTVEALLDAHLLD